MTVPANSAASLPLSSSLEDYLETIYLLVQEHGFARVKEIARAREVKAASVSIALRKLAELELVRYERREYVALTEKGEQLGRRVFSRHRLLTRFFEQVLQMPAAAAQEQACAMEHSLTDEAMERLASFFEFLGTCPQVPGDLLENFRHCASGRTARSGGREGHIRCSSTCGRPATEAHPALALSELQPGQHARVTHVGGRGPLRQRLLDMGLLPDTPVDLERVGPGGDAFWIRCQGAQLELRRNEAASILVTRG